MPQKTSTDNVLPGHCQTEGACDHPDVRDLFDLASGVLDGWINATVVFHIWQTKAGVMPSGLATDHIDNNMKGLNDMVKQAKMYFQHDVKQYLYRPELSGARVFLGEPGASLKKVPDYQKLLQ